MLYNLFKYLDTVYDLPGSGMFQYITFRSIAAFILALLMVIYIGKPIIRKLQKLQIGEEILMKCLSEVEDKFGQYARMTLEQYGYRWGILYE